MMEHALMSERLGFGPDARLLIVNADDYGMCHTENEASIRAIQEGLACSCTIMMPCPWSLHGLQLLKDNPEISFGVHLTAVSEHKLYRWGPLTNAPQVPSLVDEDGWFYAEDRIPEFLSRVDVAELELEFTAQIEAVLQAGLSPTHLDSHCNIHVRHDAVFEMTADLARSYGLPLRAGNTSHIERLRQLGVPTTDHGPLDSYRLPVQDKPRLFRQLLRELPPGVSEWALHPGTPTAELQAITPTWPVRQTDYDFLMSPEAQEWVQAEGIIMLTWQPLQELWANSPGSLSR